MAWSAPMTAVANSAFTAAQFNQYVRDNLNECPAAKVTSATQYAVADGSHHFAARTPASAWVGASESSSSGSYTDLNTWGPAVTVTTGTAALVSISAYMSNSTAAAKTYASIWITGATTAPADDTWAVIYQAWSAGSSDTRSRTWLWTGLTPGANTFQMKYKVSAGTGTWLLRNVSVMPL